MGKNKHSGGGKGMSRMIKPISGMFKSKKHNVLSDMRGDSDEDTDEHPEMNGIPRVLPIIPVSEYQMPSDFMPYRDAKDYWVTQSRPIPLITQGKCYEYVYVDRVSEDGKTAWATMRPNYAGKYHYVKTIERRGIHMTLFWFDVEDNGIKYTNLVEAPSNPYYTDRYGIKALWVRVVPCDSIEPGEIPSLQRLAYNKVSDADKQLLHDTIDFPVPPRKGGNKHSGGGNCQGRECVREEDDAVQEPELKRELPIIRVPEYEIDRGFKQYRTPDVFKYFDRSDSNYHNPYPTRDILDPGKCYEYVYVDRFGPGRRFYATMRPNYAGKYVTTTEYYGQNSEMGSAESKFIVQENGLDYENYVISASRMYAFGEPGTIDSMTGLPSWARRPTFFREVPCKPVEIPSLQSLAYRGIKSKKVRKQLHDTTDILPPPTAGGNSVKRNKRSVRKTKRKSRKNTRRKSIKNKL